jgi:hypothetical protein
LVVVVVVVVWVYGGTSGDGAAEGVGNELVLMLMLHVGDVEIE